MSAEVAVTDAMALPEHRRLPAWVQSLARSLETPQMRAGLFVTSLIVLLALIGPYVAPHSSTAYVATPLTGPSGVAPLGTDFLGRDVLSRVLDGGRSVVALSLAATALGAGLGLIVGLVAGYSRSLVDDLLMGVSDVVLAFPQIVLVLLFVSIVGPKVWLIVLVVAVSHSPRVARLARSVTLELINREFVESALLIGIPRRRILTQEILPNLATPLLVEFGLRLTWSVGLIAGLSFLGYGIQPPNADWGLMINENRQGLAVQPLAAAAPILCIFLFTIGTNLMTEGLSRTVAGIAQRGDH